MKTLVIAAMLLTVPVSSWSALPLITDDTGTQGKGGFQIEAGAVYDREKEAVDGTEVKETDLAVFSTFTYGLRNRVDLFVNVPYIKARSESGGDPAVRVNGVSDAGIGAKWRFFERGGTSLALKPFFTVATGNEEKGLGTGKNDYGLVLIASQDAGPVFFHANLGYTRNENKIGERKDLWQASLASTYELAKDVKLCADIGAFTNTDRTSEVEPRYALAGVIYSVNEDLELSFGLKHGLSEPETDWTVLPGITYRF